MKTLYGSILLILLIGLNISFAQQEKVDWIFQPEDKRIAEETMNSFLSKSDLPISELITKIGLSFLGTPYTAATLENGIDEKLVINLREMDCTTFIENCLALARVVKLEKTDFESFASELEKIRYRDGIRNGYPSRLHYFSDWIHNNHKKGFIDKSPNQNGEKTERTINFMSTHPTSYPVLKEHPELIPSIADQEKELSKAEFRYYKKNNFKILYDNLQNGDIVGLTSTTNGIDINHTGIIVSKDNEFYLLHAAQSWKKVVISNEPLTDFLKPQSKNSGVMIARPVFKN